MSLILVLVTSFVVPNRLAQRYIAVGEGPDEIAHLDHIFFRYTRPDSVIKVEQGLVEPGVSPHGQGHQAPLLYETAAAVLPLWVPASAVGPLWDYQAGIGFSSMAAYTHGKPSCEVRLSEPPGEDGYLIRKAILHLRAANAFLLPLSVVLTFFAARLLFPQRRLLWLAAALVHAGTPTAVWRSSFITNDNVVAVWGSLVFVLAAMYASRPNASLRLVLGASLAAAVSFLSKYTGAALVPAIGAAILLRPRTSLRNRILHVLVAGTVFATCIAPELLENLRVEGDAFLTAVVAHEFPYLYKPSSLWHVLAGSEFLPVLKWTPKSRPQNPIFLLWSRPSSAHPDPLPVS